MDLSSFRVGTDDIDGQADTIRLEDGVGPEILRAPGGAWMSPRDYFAGQALAALRDWDKSDEVIADRCYGIADAMIAEREKAK